MPLLLPSHSDRSDEHPKFLHRLPAACDRGHSAVLRSAVRADASLLENDASLFVEFGVLRQSCAVRGR
jgi:hypothetical protein